MRILLRALPLMTLLCLAANCRPAAAQALFTDWVDDADVENSWTAGSNWSGGNVPNVLNEDFARISIAAPGANSTATISTVVSEQAGGVILGFAAGQTGTLQINSGGQLTVVDDPSFPADGSMRLGVTDGGAAGGTGILSIAPGGRLDSVSLISGGEVGSTITLGGTTAGTTIVNTGAVTLGRTTRVIGPNVNFSATGTVQLQATSVLIPEITGASHSPLKTTGAAAINGTLQLDFTVHMPVVGNSWNLVDAASISGSFTTIDTSMAPTLGPGQVFAVRQQSAGSINGQVLQLYVDQVLVLNVDRDSGVVSISNPGASGIALDGYRINSPGGALNPTNWNSLEEQAIGGWTEANPTVNNLAELKESGSSTLGGGLSWNLGTVFDPPTPSEFGVSVSDDLTFSYTQPTGGPAGTIVDGVVEYTGTPVFNNFVLYVDPSDGQTHLRNVSDFTVDFDAYTITSPAGRLLFANDEWISLDDQNADDGSWAEANSSATRISELQGGGTTTMAPNATFDLGTLFNTGGAEDLVFQFLRDDGTPAGVLMDGIVVYEPLPAAGVPGDYNDDGVVDAADYVIWRKYNGTSTMLPNDEIGGMIGAAHYNQWRDHFGETAGAGSGGSLSEVGGAVPEPATCLVAGWLAMALACGRRRSFSLTKN